MCWCQKGVKPWWGLQALRVSTWGSAQGSHAGLSSTACVCKPACKRNFSTEEGITSSITLARAVGVGDKQNMSKPGRWLCAVKLPLPLLLLGCTSSSSTRP